MKRNIVIISFFIGLLLVIVAHLSGYKIYGSPTLYENQPLDRPKKVATINQAGEIVLAEGNQYRIYGIKTILSDPWRQIKYFQRQLPTFEVEIADPDKPVSKVWCKTRIVGWCGNVFFPRFFPGKLGRFRKEDLGTSLVWMGGAIPTIEVFKEDPNYAKHLTLIMRDAAPRLEFGKDKDYAYKLGRFLIKEHPEFFNIGAWLLAHYGDPEISNLVKNRTEESIKVYNKEVKIKGGYYSYPRYTSDFTKEILDLSSILIKVSDEEARQFLRKIIQRRTSHYTRVRLAQKLFSIDDLYGFDLLMEEMMKTDLGEGYRAGLMHEMDYMLSNYTPGKYYAADDPKEMYEWYKKNKSKLVWNDEKQQMALRKDDNSNR